MCYSLRKGHEYYKYHPGTQRKGQFFPAECIILASRTRVKSSLYTDANYQTSNSIASRLSKPDECKILVVHGYLDNLSRHSLLPRTTIRREIECCCSILLKHCETTNTRRRSSQFVNRGRTIVHRPGPVPSSCPQPRRH